MKISVAMCTYNGAKFIVEQINSILGQTYPVDEIIICDDGSSDSTLSLLKQILNQSNVNFKVHQNKASLGVIKNFNQCYAMCNGDIIFSCDQDDIWQLNKVEKIMCEFQDSTINLVATNALLIDEKGDSLNNTLRNAVGFAVASSNEMWIDSLLQWFCVTGATMAFRKSFYKEVFYESEFWLHDGWLAMFAALRNSMRYLDDTLTKYRIHTNNACGLGMFKVIPTALKKPYFFEDFAYQRMVLFNEVNEFIVKNKVRCEKENLEKLHECILFWKVRASIKSQTYKQCKEMRKEFKINKAYMKYTKEKAYYWLDLYFWLVYKLRPRKNRG